MATAANPGGSPQHSEGIANILADVFKGPRLVGPRADLHFGKQQVRRKKDPNGCLEFRWHDLRHTLACWAVMRVASRSSAQPSEGWWAAQGSNLRPSG